MSVSVSVVPPGQTAEYWPYVSPLIEKALVHGWNTPEEVYALIDESKAQCWLAIENNRVIGTWVTRIEQADIGRFCLVWLGGGEQSNKWIPLIQEYTEPWAKENGCKEMQIVGRKGWVKRLPEYKWTAVVLRKEL